MPSAASMLVRMTRPWLSFAPRSRTPSGSARPTTSMSYAITGGNGHRGGAPFRELHCWEGRADE